MRLDDMIVVGLILSLAGLSLAMAILSLHTPYHGSVLSEQRFKVANSDWCDTLYIEHVRPFRFTMSKHSGTFSCGWPSTNTAFRTTLSLFGFLLTGGAAVLAYKEENAALRKVSAIFGLCGACWLSVATLDANALSVGNALCLGGFKVDSDGDSYHLLTGFNKSDLSTGENVATAISALTSYAEFSKMMTLYLEDGQSPCVCPPLLNDKGEFEFE